MLLSMISLYLLNKHERINISASTQTPGHTLIFDGDFESSSTVSIESIEYSQLICIMMMIVITIDNIII